MVIVCIVCGVLVNYNENSSSTTVPIKGWCDFCIKKSNQFSKLSKPKPNKKSKKNIDNP